ncbi:hypothetical protein DENIS_2301 [Desulfonema ishimotonii]|uniref:Surface lipoprotein assembly modifier C-terminal domain-containing protein n=1 Tax=Desulfonema ishimotonii TaxID=45657 RepID=A0A401FWK8_9BACT|nr:tetratricopeptide repeat protein [Desulfonema ishimotonii]GBC61341.1 hypothetical protein DENIS_2301 [Desulfonema ishimotonii]
MQKIFGYVLILLLMVSAGQAACASDTAAEGRAYYDFGVFDYEEGNYTDAEKNFKIALGFEPENPFYNHYLGKTYLKTARYADAERYLNSAWEISPAISGLKYDIGFLRYKTGDYTGASELFKAVAEEEPRNVLAHYYAGISLYREGRHRAAAPWFVHAAENSPTIRANGYFYAGLCYQKTGDDLRALSVFGYVRDDPNAGDLKESAVRWITAIEERQKRVRPYGLYARIGRRYDDNVTLEPDDGDIFADESDWATLACFSGYYNFLRREKYRVGAGFSQYQTWHDDLDEYDMSGSVFNLYAAYDLLPFTLRMNITPAYYLADSDSYLRQYRLEPEIRWRVTDRLLTRLVYRYDDNTYFEDAGRTGHANTLYAEAYYSFFSGRGILFGKIGHEDRTATRRDEYFDRWEMRVGTVWMLPWELEMEVTGEYAVKNYDGPDQFWLTEREDDRYTATVSLSRKIFYDRLALLGEYRYTRNDSNISDYEYSRNIFTLSLTASY